MVDGGGGRIAHTVTREEGRGGGGCYSWIFQGQVCVQWKEERDASVIESEKGTRQVFISPLRSVTESRWTIAICLAEFCSTVAWFLVGMYPVGHVVQAFGCCFSLFGLRSQEGKRAEPSESD